jgi:hypothetical protein
MEGTLRSVVASLLIGLCAAAHAAPGDGLDVCYVRPESVPAEDTANKASGSDTQSYLGLRRKATQLFEVKLTLVGQEGAVCSIAGVARLRGSAGQEILVLPVRPEPGTDRSRSGTLCLIYVQLTSTAVEIATTEATCQAQALCGGKVRVQGQRFEHSDRVAPGVKGPCWP